MTLISQAVLARAAIDVNRMSAAQKVQLADEIYVKQPNLLASILVLPRFGVSALQLEAPIHVLLVTYQAIKRCGHTLPVISEDVQDACMQRLTATIRFTEGVPPALASQMITQHCADHPERNLLAFVYGWRARPPERANRRREVPTPGRTQPRRVRRLHRSPASTSMSLLLGRSRWSDWTLTSLLQS